MITVDTLTAAIDYLADGPDLRRCDLCNGSTQLVPDPDVLMCRDQDRCGWSQSLEPAAT